MADQRVTELAAVAVPALTDLTAVRQSGDARDKKETLAQILSLVVIPPEVNDLSAAVVWANIPDANVPSSAVVQHQAALTILEGQITGAAFTNWNTAFGWGNHALAGYLTSFTEVNDLSTAVIWANIPDANVPASAVTQHQAALAILRAQLTDLATVGQAEAEAGVATTDRIWTAERVAQAIAALGGGGGFPEYHFYADQFENPNNSDWNITVLAPAAADSNNAALTVRLFDDAVAEGVGIQFRIPVGATSLIFNTVSRAETAPGVAAVAKPRIHFRTIGDDAAVPAPPNTQFSLLDINIPTNENFQYDSQTITLAFLGLTAGDYVQFEYSRNPTHPNDDLVGDWALLSLLMSFT